MIPAPQTSRAIRLPPGRRGASGFTILELLLVVALIATLSGMVLGAGHYARNSGRASLASGELAALAAALESYRMAHGDYPRTDQSAGLLQALLGRRAPAGDAITARPVIDTGRFTVENGGSPNINESATLLDPWGESYRYVYKSALPWGNPGYVLYSAGPDGLAGTALLPGGFPDYFSPGNDDNLWANPP